MKRSAMLGTSLMLMLAVIPAAKAEWNPPSFGCGAIEAYVGYTGQSTCSPTAKPGVIAFRNAILAAHPGTSDLGIIRACHKGGQSEHKEGRAWDWGVVVGNPAADDVLNKLLATDACGQPHALARRVGVMYMIFNKKIWRAYKPSLGWQPFTGSNPHTDHVHFSFSWAAANAETSFYGGSCKPICDGTKIVKADCSSGDCGAFGATCIYQAGGTTCAVAGCTPKCTGTAFVDASCATGDCGAFGAKCAMKAGKPQCVVECDPHCEGDVMVGSDCSKGDCGAFGAICTMKAGEPTCKTPCTPQCKGSIMVSKDCSEGDCAAFGATCEMKGGEPDCVVACDPHCEGSVMVAADCSTGDCGAFGATCVMKVGEPTCKTPCTPHCEGTKVIDAACGVGDCAAFGATCKDTGDGPECVEGCTPHCEGTVKVEADCSKGDCGAFGVPCTFVNGKVGCGEASCTPKCDGTKMVYSDCSVGDCGVFGLTCGSFDEGPQCVPATCETKCDGSKIIYEDCSTGDCAVFGAKCSVIGGAPTCVSEFCTDPGTGASVEKDVCVGDERFHCNASGQLLEKPCPAAQKCNACAGCGPTPAEVCDAVDNDCDGAVDEGVKNACGACGDTPVEVCDYVDNDCDGAIDEGVKNACGACGDTPVEVCDYADNDCDGEVDEGVLNACGACGAVPVEVCDYADNDCDGAVDEGFEGLGDTCEAGQGACLRIGARACTPGTEVLTCTATPGLPTVEICNGIDDDCDGTVDEGFEVGAACTFGEGGCTGEGVLVCDANGEEICYTVVESCDDGDPCTFDLCQGDAQCEHLPRPDCCASLGECGDGQSCEDGLCVSTQCAPCESAADCGAPDAQCLAMGAETRCVLPCDETCPDGFSCTPVGAESPVCVPEEGSECVCALISEPVCLHGLLVRLDVCGTYRDVLGACPGVGDNGEAGAEDATGSAPVKAERNSGCIAAGTGATMPMAMVLLALLLLCWIRRRVRL